MTIQQNSTKPELVFWFDAPPRAGAGVFQYVAQCWGTKVYYLCIEPLSEARRAGGWEDCDHGPAVMTIVSEQPDPVQFIRDFVRQHAGAIHVCNGFRSLTTPYVKKWLFTVPEARIAMWSERPNLYGSPMKLLALRLLHRYYAVRYSKNTSVYLALGMIGVETFARCGWDRKSLFPFMYDPQITGILPEPAPRTPGDPLRMIYVGRFAKATKGVDVLIDAMDTLSGDNWRLDLVGGYGDYKDQAIAWAERHPNVTFCGTWPSNEISQRIAQYDVCVVPSRYDGWNVVTNEAIRAGIGVIVTDAAASDDLVKASGAGVVVPAGDASALRSVIRQVIDDPGLADSWKERAKAYSPRISSESVGRYFMDVLEYTFLPAQPRPKCPWL